MITDENKSLAYCHVPKAASTTWMVAFAKTNSVANFTEMLQRVALHEALLEKFAIDGEKLESNTFTFTFIRHPFHRIVSTYLTSNMPLIQLWCARSKLNMDEICSVNIHL